MARASFTELVMLLKSPAKAPIQVTNHDGHHIANLQAFGTVSDIPSKWAADVAKWRNAHSDRFATQFLANTENAEKYLQNVARSDDQILFMITSLEGERLGHFGFKRNAEGIVELDNLIRSDSPAPSQLVFYVELTLLQMLFTNSTVESVQVMVLGSNKAAHGLHRLCGFKKDRKVQVVSKKSNGVVTFEELSDDKKGDESFVYLSIDDKTFRQRFSEWLSNRPSERERSNAIS